MIMITIIVSLMIIGCISISLMIMICMISIVIMIMIMIMSISSSSSSSSSSGGGGGGGGGGDGGSSSSRSVHVLLLCDVMAKPVVVRHALPRYVHVGPFMYWFGNHVHSLRFFLEIHNTQIPGVFGVCMVLLISSELVKCRLLKCLLEHPMNHKPLLQSLSIHIYIYIYTYQHTYVYNTYIYIYIYAIMYI